MLYQMRQSSYLTDYEKVKRQVKDSDLLFTDGKHRIAGIRFLKDVKHMAQVSYIGMRWEIPFARQIAFENGKRIITDSNFSLRLVRDFFIGDIVYYENDMIKDLEKRILLSDVIITDGKYCSIGLMYDSKNMEAPEITFLSVDVDYVTQTARKHNILERTDRPLARELFSNHNPGEEITSSYYSVVAEIYSKIF